jgi:predicted alpha/beta-fold hydrolase
MNGFLRSPVLQTAISWLHSGSSLPEKPEEVRLIPVEGGALEARVSPPAGTLPPARVLLLFHGLCGCSLSSYMCRTAALASQRGFLAVRVISRDHGGTQHLSRAAYHAGRSDDLRAALDWALAAWPEARVGMAGFSLGGSTLLKMAGEMGGDAPERLLGVCAVSPPLDLALAQAFLRERRPYIDGYFVSHLRRMYARKASLYPDLYPLELLDGVGSIREFDERITAPFNGFSSADDYYERSSAERQLAAIRIPTRIIFAQDDPVVPWEPWRRYLEGQEGESPLRIDAPPHGGHIGFLRWDFSRPVPLVYWAEEELLRFFAEA